MQAELEMPRKPKSFYQRHIRPALVRLVRPRRKSVWNLELDDDEGGSQLGDAMSAAGNLAVGVMRIGILALGQALLILLPMLYLAQLALGTPQGLPGVVGQHLADVCLSGGSCDLKVLLPSYAFAVILVINMFALIIYGVLSGLGYLDQPEPNDLPLAVAVVDERLRELHDELINAGVLPEPVRTEADDDH